MLFVLGVVFIIITLGIVVYNRPKGVTPIEAILESTDDLYVDRAHKEYIGPKRVKKDKKKDKKRKKEEPQVIVGDDCSGSLECPVSLGNGGHKNEQRCRMILERIFGKSFPSVRPNWLKNPATKRNLELDMYCHQLRLACEYQGIQHYKMTQFHGNKRELLYQMKRDAYKAKKCKELGVTLIQVPYWANSDLEGYITRKLEEIHKLPPGFHSIKLAKENMDV